MGVVLSGPRSKEAFLRSQAQKARFTAREARKADDPVEAARQEEVAEKAEHAADLIREQMDDISS